MTTDELLNIAEVLQNISGEAILKRRQSYFYDLYTLDNNHKTFLTHLASLSIALNSSQDLGPKITINTSRIPFSEALGKVLYFLLEDDLVKTRRELHKLPHYLQVIISFTLSKRLASQLTQEFLLNTLDNFETLPELLSIFDISMHSPIPAEIFLEKSISFSSSGEITYPFWLVKRTKAQRNTGKLYYLTKGPEGVSTNIPNKMVKDYLAKSCNLTQYGIIISMVFNKKKSRIKYIQPILFDTDIDSIKRYYKGKGNYTPLLLPFFGQFKQPPSTIEVGLKTATYISNKEDLLDTPWKLLNGNLLLYSTGISTLSNKSYKVRGKVVDWLLNEEYEPLGYKVLVSNTVHNVRCTITNSDIDRGIENLYLNLKETKFLGETVRMEYFAQLSYKFRECALCGAVESLISKYLCYKCHTRLFKVASASTLDRFEYDLEVPFKAGVKFPMYKYDVEFSEESIGFTENMALVRGKQLRLPADWWSKEDWVWESYSGQLSLSMKTSTLI